MILLLSKWGFEGSLPWTVCRFEAKACSEAAKHLLKLSFFPRQFSRFLGLATLGGIRIDLLRKTHLIFIDKLAQVELDLFASRRGRFEQLLVSTQS